MKKLILITLLGATLSFANGPQNGQGPRNGTPPEEAITACEGLNTNDTCNMTTPRGDSISGTCQNTPDEKYFVCMPEGMKKR